MTFFTIGYGGRRPADFVELLHRHGVRTIVDVRKYPNHSHMGAYVKAKSNDKGIEKLLKEANVDYLWCEKLGNEFMKMPGWSENYATALIERLPACEQQLLDAEAPMCLLCAEKRAEDCHRKIIADELEKRGHTAIHIE